MSNKNFETTRIVAAVVVLAGAWDSTRAADDTLKRRDEARLVLMRERVEEIAASDREAEKQAAVDAFSDIVSDYFLATRVKPVEGGDEQAQAAYVMNVSLLHEMLVQAKRCKEGDAEACKKLDALIDEFRESFIDGGKPGEPKADSDEEKKAEPKKTGGADQPDEKAKDEGSDDKADFQTSEAENLLLKYINAYRKKQGLEPLRLDEKLCQAARDHSGDMNKHSFFSHDSPVPGRTKFTDRAKLHGATAHAENIARDCKDAVMAMKLWVNSQHHRANLTGSYTRVGVGVDDKGFYTQVFGK